MNNPSVMFTGSHNDEERRNNSEPPIVVNVLRKTSSWRKRFKIKKKSEISTPTTAHNKNTTPENDCSTPDGKDADIFTFNVDAASAGSCQNLSIFSRRLLPSKENRSNGGQLEKCKWMNQIVNQKDEMLRRYSTYSYSSYNQSDCTEVDTSMTRSSETSETTARLLSYKRMSRSCETLLMSCANSENYGNNTALYNTNTTLYNNNTTLLSNKNRLSDNTLTCESDCKDISEAGPPPASSPGPPVSPNRRKQGTTNYPVIRGRNISQLTHQESLECSLSLLDLPVNNIKRTRAGSPSRFGKRIARKFATLSQSHEGMLLHAVSNQDYEMIEKLTSGEDNDGYDINYSYPPGVTILHQACVIGDFDVVKLFVERGADVNRKTWTELSPAKLAVIYGHFDVAQLLLLAGADVDDIKHGIQMEDKEIC